MVQARLVMNPLASCISVILSIHVCIAASGVAQENKWLQCLIECVAANLCQTVFGYHSVCNHLDTQACPTMAKHLPKSSWVLWNIHAYKTKHSRWHCSDFTHHKNIFCCLNSRCSLRWWYSWCAVCSSLCSPLWYLSCASCFIKSNCTVACR